MVLNPYLMQEIFQVQVTPRWNTEKEMVQELQLYLL